uniref:Retrotransposon gag protein n=1 Tax=Solanum tuberosum TaxID=4113 RepID=M1DJR0_SOLTU
MESRVTHGPWMATCSTGSPPQKQSKISAKGQPMLGPTNRRSGHGSWSRAEGQTPKISASSIDPRTVGLTTNRRIVMFIGQLYSIMYVQYLSSTDAYGPLNGAYTSDPTFSSCGFMSVISSSITVSLYCIDHVISYNQIPVSAYPGATLSSVTPYIASNFNVSLETLLEPFSVSTPVGDPAIARRVYRNSPVTIS